MSKIYHELKFNHYDLYYNPHAWINLYHEKNASNAKTWTTEAKITIVSQLYHHLKLNHHDIYYNPHACIYLDCEKMDQMQKQDAAINVQTWQPQLKKTIFLENKPKMKNKTPEIKGRIFYNHAT